MARPEATAIGGFYPTPPALVPRIARLLEVAPAGEDDHGHWPIFSAVDPCAGDGAAIMGLAHALVDPGIERQAVHLFVCEMEATRAEALRARRGRDHASTAMAVLHGDAFRVEWSHSRWSEGAGLLYLNPPYDTDPEHGRLEQRFLDRFAPVLGTGGVLVFVVPHYALEASADLLARDFTDLHCFRFPFGDFEAFKQVVLVARRGPGLFEPDASLRERVLGWARHPKSAPELPEAGPAVVSVPRLDRGLSKWELARFDVEGLRRRFRPWHQTDRCGRPQPLPGLVPEVPALELLARSYPLAVPPRPAHIAAGIAAGVFNGARVEPDDPKSPLPPILVKGSFDREFVAIEDKVNKDGDKVGEVQVQQPRLVVTALDLRTRRYHTLASSTEETGARSLDGATTADLVAAYGRGLMRRMLEHCPVLHDPTDPSAEVEIAPMARALFQGQRHPTMAVVKLLGGAAASRRARRGKAAFLLGEIGAGKSTVALAAALTVGARRPLVLCPPHLLDSWRDQVKACLPDAVVRVLASVADVDAFAADESSGVVVGVLSREAAKLGHAWVGVVGSCPRCGAAVPPGDLARTRARCEHQALRPLDAVARAAVELALLLQPSAPGRGIVRQLLPGRHLERVRAAAARRLDRQQEKVLGLDVAVDEGWPATRAESLLPVVLDAAEPSKEWIDALLRLAGAVHRPDALCQLARYAWARGADDLSPYGHGAAWRALARKVALLLPLGSIEYVRLVERLRALPQDRDVGYGDGPWKGFEGALTALNAGAKTPWGFEELSTVGGVVHVDKAPLGSSKLALDALTRIAKLGKWARSAPCGEIIYCAVPEPRRVPLATYIARRHPRAFDLLILDEAHEASGDGSAQGFAAHRLTGLGHPVIALTGSVMNGYAESLFANQWALDPQFRAEFGRDDRAAFVTRYGYVKRLVEERDRNGKVTVFGAVSDRVERTARTIGQAPGVLPVFLLRHLLRRAVTLHKADLALDLPPCTESVVRVEPSPELLERYKRLERALVAQLKRDRFTPLAGKLFGQLAELPSFLDRATLDVGNGDDGAFTVAYPEAAGGQVIAREDGLPAGEVLPKERWLLETVRAELDEGRRVLVFAWHTTLLPRLVRLLEAGLGERVPLLDAGKIAAGKRQSWIDREVIARRRRVLAVNPIAVQTGLNNLVHFATEIWMENPACNAIAYRQAVGRVDRIGQRAPTRILFPVYAGTTQEALHRLLLHKVAVSQAADGLDAESALAAAGVGAGSGLEALTVGRQLFAMLGG